MDVIYCCYAGAHTSITAAALHVGMISSKRPPNLSEVLALPNFDQTTQAELGKVFRFGVDEYGNNVYIAALGPGRAATLSALRLVLRECGKRIDDFLVVDALACVTLPVRVGGFLSRRLGVVSIGRPMCAQGIIRNFSCFVQLVAEVKRACHNNP